MMLTTVRAGPYSIRGISVGGVYTSLFIPELHALLDVGIALRSIAAADALFLSHAHADHVGAIVSLLGIRGLLGLGPMRVFLPAEIADDLQQALLCMSRLQRYDLSIDAVPMRPGDEQPYRGDISVRAFRTFHPVPSLGFQFIRRVSKLKPEFSGLPGEEIGRRRKAGDDIFYIEERAELAYATDTLVRVLDETPSLLKTRTLILECSFLDERKSLEASRAGCHIHLDELLERADSFECEHLVLMHFSQIYRPHEIAPLLQKRCPADLYSRIVPFAPVGRYWPG
jgi:ribonuclease Z